MTSPGQSAGADASEGVELEVTALGSGGDGIAETADGRVYLPGGLPGERWRVRLAARMAEGWRAEPVTRLAGPLRAEPICRHFGTCGGCRLQHVPPAAYAAFKRQRILDALARRGLPGATVAEPALAPLASRRRLRLGLVAVGRGLGLGLRVRGSHRIEPIAECPIAEPALVAALPALARELASALARPWPVEASLTTTESGLDLVLHAARPALPTERTALAAMAERLDLARVSWSAGGGAEPLAVRRPPLVHLATVPVELPPGAFLQATRFGEACLAEAVRDWAGGARQAIDLFAGLGSLTFVLAGLARSVRAFEADAAAVAALRRAAGQAGLGRVQAEARDLDRRPLTPPELGRCDLVLLDPPRAGAAAQAAMLARSGLKRIIYASCQPESFARDARTLIDAGFVLRELRPIDQFPFAAEVELIALLERSQGPEKGLIPARPVAI